MWIAFPCHNVIMEKNLSANVLGQTSISWFRHSSGLNHKAFKGDSSHVHQHRIYCTSSCAHITWYFILYHYHNDGEECHLSYMCFGLTHWGRVTHICVSKLTIIGSDNGLPPDRRQAIIWTNAGLMLIGPFGTNFGEILIEILTFSFKKMRLKVSSAKRRPFCLGLNVLICVFCSNF